MGESNKDKEGKDKITSTLDTKVFCHLCINSVIIDIILGIIPNKQWTLIIIYYLKRCAYNCRESFLNYSLFSKVYTESGALCQCSKVFCHLCINSVIIYIIFGNHIK